MRTTGVLRPRICARCCSLGTISATMSDSDPDSPAYTLLKAGSKFRPRRPRRGSSVRRLKVNLFVTSPPCVEHSSAHTKRRGGRSETGSWYAKCADEAIKAGVRVAHIIVECTTGVQEHNGCAHSPLEGLISALQGSYHVQQIKVDTPTVCSPYNLLNGFVAPVHHTRQYVVATLKSLRKDPMDFDVSAGRVLVHDASAIVGKISLGDKYQAMPESDARQLNRKLRRGGVGRPRNTIHCVARVAGCSETALSEGCFRLRVINPLNLKLKGLFKVHHVYWSGGGRLDRRHP
jgi:hypothetical protein